VASSDKAYGEHDSLPYQEDFALRPTAPYEVSKACADLIARSYHQNFGLPVVVSRFANIYGGGDLNFSRLVPETCRSIVLNQNPILRSDGSPERDYIYVDDVVDLYLRLSERASDPAFAGEAFNAGSDQPWSVLKVVEMLLEISGKRNLRPDIRGSGSPAGEISRQFLDASKVKKVLGWQPSVSISDGLRTTLNWYEQHRSLLEQM
jgi:CDP-glucose 4,6-dehydratase